MIIIFVTVLVILGVLAALAIIHHMTTSGALYPGLKKPGETKMAYNQTTRLGSPLFQFGGDGKKSKIAQNIAVRDVVTAIGPFGVQEMRVESVSCGDGVGGCTLSNATYVAHAIYDPHYVSPSSSQKLKLPQIAWRLNDFRQREGTVWYSEAPNIVLPEDKLQFNKKAVKWIEDHLILPEEEIDPYVFFWFMFDGFRNDDYDALQVIFDAQGDFSVQAASEPPLEFDDDESVEIPTVEVDPEPLTGVSDAASASPWSDQPPIPGDEPILWDAAPEPAPAPEPSYDMGGSVSSDTSSCDTGDCSGCSGCCAE